MTATIQKRHPSGRPTGGRFSPDEHAEPKVALAGAQPGYLARHPEWDHIAADLVEDGLTREEARGVVAMGTALELATHHSRAAQQLLARGDDTSAALYAIALKTAQTLPGRLHAAKAGLAGMAEEVEAARAQLTRNGALLDAAHPSGRQPVFAATDEILADMHSYLTAQAAPKS